MNTATAKPVELRLVPKVPARHPAVIEFEQWLTKHQRVDCAQAMVAWDESTGETYINVNLWSGDRERFDQQRVLGDHRRDPERLIEMSKAEFKGWYINKGPAAI